MFLFFDTETTGLPAKGQYSNPSHPSTPKLADVQACARIFFEGRKRNLWV